MLGKGEPRAQDAASEGKSVAGLPPVTWPHAHTRQRCPPRVHSQTRSPHPTGQHFPLTMRGLKLPSASVSTEGPGF